ncbi:MAG TPA: hypothetical protein VNP93_11770 [Gaiellaceae bacterium]|nr:hypothetical protein [Gaiellaceae bacterium]
MIARRFRGPQSSGNGGYAAGLLASFLDGAAEVTLRLPPPLERALTVERRGDVTLLLDDANVVAEAVPAEVVLEAPAPPSLEEAALASARYAPIGPETFRGCFSCGAIREEGDGLRILPGRVEGRELVAAPWVAQEPSLPVVWAAIDCSGAYAVAEEGRGDAVLGRMAARIDRLPLDGERCVVVGWPRGEDGRKLHAGTALHSEAGELLAVARQTWIAPRQAT